MKLKLAAVAFLVFAFAKAQNNLEQQINDIESKVIEWRRDFHQNPELGNREFKTAEKIAAHLKSLGMKVQTGVAKTGVVGILEGKRKGKVLALRADIDGLPVKERADLPFKSSDLLNLSSRRKRTAILASVYGTEKVTRF